MKLRTTVKIIIISFLLFMAVIGAIVIVSHSLASNMKNLPVGEKIDSYDSPSGEYTVNIYLDNGGATVDFAIRGELLNNSNNIKKNIYWCYARNSAKVEWIDNETVVINGKTLNVLTDVYNWRTDSHWDDNYDIYTGQWKDIATSDI
ncbi:hypothetical protein AGMMS50284_4830 [Clostridia bacterium]|nr:hypothetical protein AGMMS50284_4830 [Clostridia bacterium]